MGIGTSLEDSRNKLKLLKYSIDLAKILSSILVSF